MKRAALIIACIASPCLADSNMQLEANKQAICENMGTLAVLSLRLRDRGDPPHVFPAPKSFDIRLAEAVIADAVSRPTGTEYETRTQAFAYCFDKLPDYIAGRL